MRPLIASLLPLPSTIVVSSLVMLTRRARPSEVELRGVELAADLLGDDLAAGQDRDVLQHRLAAIAEARRLDRDDVDRAAELVDDEGGERLAVDVLGDRSRAFLPTWRTFSSIGRMSAIAEIFLSVMRM